MLRRLALIVLLAPLLAAAQPGTWAADPPEQTRTCWLYARYAVLTHDGPEGRGEAVAVVRRVGRGRATCAAPPSAAVLTVGAPGEARYFAGLADPYLLVDVGTGPDGRALEVYDVERGALVWSGGYRRDEVEVERDGSGTALAVSFFVPLGDDGGGRRPCPESEAGGWGRSYGFDERVRLDLQAGAVERTGHVECSYRQ